MLYQKLENCEKNLEFQNVFMDLLYILLISWIPIASHKIIFTVNRIEISNMTGEMVTKKKYSKDM